MQGGPHDFLTCRVFPSGSRHFPGLLSQRFQTAALHFPPKSHSLWVAGQGRSQGWYSSFCVKLTHPAHSFTTHGSKASSEVLLEFGS